MIFFSILKAIQILIIISVFFVSKQNASIYMKSVKDLIAFCQNGFSVLQVIIRSINKGFEPFKQFYSTLNCMFSVVCFLET